MSDSDRSRRVAEHYSSHALSYKELWAPELRRAAYPLIRQLPLQHADRILDLGCGVGSLLPDLREAAAATCIVGVDRTEAMLRLAPTENPLAVMDACELAFVDAQFDVVSIAYALFHFSDIPGALLETKRVLRPGGTLGVITWGPDRSSTAQQVWSDELDSHGAEPDDPDFADHEIVDAPSKMETLLGRAGYGEVRVWTDSFDAHFTRDAFFAARTRLGRSRKRLETLEPEIRAACIRRAKERLASLSEEEFVDRTPVIYSVASA